MKKPILVLPIVITAAALLGSGLPAAAQPKSPPVVQSVLPGSNIGLSKGDSKLLTLQGSNFIYVSSAEMILEGAPTAARSAPSLPLRPPSGVKVSLTGNRTSTSLGLLVEAPFTAPDGVYLLRLWAGGEAFDVSRELLRVTLAWARAQIQDCVPRQGPIGLVVKLRGKYFGDPAQPDRTRFLIPMRQSNGTIANGTMEKVSMSATEATVRIPDGAVYGILDAETPAGFSWRTPAIYFDPLYVHTLPPNLFQPEGTLGILHFSESLFIFADGVDNSFFIPSSAMRGLGFPDMYPFTFQPYEKYINLFIGSTKIRVRINGANRRSRTESLQSTFLNMIIDGTALKVEVKFESDGVEFFAEYETQDLLSKKITWHRFQDINIDNLSLTATLTPVFFSAQDIRIQSVTVSSSFVPGFVILGQNISVDNTPIKDYIKSEVEASLRNYLLSDDFRNSFLRIFAGQVQTLFLGCPQINRIEVSRADDGGMKLTGSTRPLR
jgi:hypothetical protein